MDQKITKFEELTDRKIIAIALKEYEENHWNSESQTWQKNINRLLEEYSNETNKQIKEKVENLLKAIIDNTMITNLYEEDTKDHEVIPLNYINEELEELKQEVNFKEDEHI